MNKLQLYPIIISILCALSLSGCNDSGPDSQQNSNNAGEAEKRPNILLIVADDLGYSDIGAFGGEIRTPAIDSLAAQGMKFTNFNVNTVCSPTRSMLLSGLDSHQVGYGTMPGLETPEQKGQPGYEMFLNDRAITVAELLKESGYHTYIAGKWDLGGRNGRGRAAHEAGFERSFILVEGLADHYRQVGVYDFLSPVTYMENGQKITLPEDFFSSRSYADKIMEFISADQGNDKPFFAFLSFTAPHYPIQAPQQDIDDYEGVYDVGYEVIRQQRAEKQRALGLLSPDLEIPEIDKAWPKWHELDDDMKKLEALRMQAYAGAVQAMDRNIGRVLAFLKSEGLLENTLVIFMSDNGSEQANPLDLGSQDWLKQYYSFDTDQIGLAGSFTWYGPGWASVSATPYRFHKHFMTRGGVLSPVIMSFPEKITPGTKTTALTTVLDIMPTFLDLAETEYPAHRYEQDLTLKPIGKSMTSLFGNHEGNIHEPDYVFALEIFDRRMVQKGDWKIVWANRPWGKGLEWELYNLTADPLETKDVSTLYPDIMQDMLNEWQAYSQRVGLIPNEGFELVIGAGQSHYEWRPPAIKVE